MRKGEALRILHEERDREGHDAPYDFTVKDEKREEAAKLDWWYTCSEDGHGDTPRTRAYFRAYVRIAADDDEIEAGTKLPAQGLRLQPKGRLWMDKYIVRAMHNRGFIEFVEKPEGMYEPAFQLTPAGLERINE